MVCLKYHNTSMQTICIMIIFNVNSIIKVYILISMSYLQFMHNPVNYFTNNVLHLKVYIYFFKYLIIRSHCTQLHKISTIYTAIPPSLIIIFFFINNAKNECLSFRVLHSNRTKKPQIKCLFSNSM